MALKVNFKKTIALILLLGLSIDHLPLPVAQITPLASLVASLLIVPLLLRLGKIHITPLLATLFLFWAWATLHSLLTLTFDLATGTNPHLRLTSWIRQVLGLLAGISLFLVLRWAFLGVSDRWIVHTTLVGAAVPILISLLQIGGDLGDIAPLRQIVSYARSLFGLEVIPNRVSGLSTEPANFGFYLASIVLPVLVGGWPLMGKAMRTIWGIGTVIALLATVSFSAYLAAAILLAATIGVSRKRIPKGWIVPLGVAAALAVAFFPLDYARRQLQALASGEWSVSILDRVYGGIGPFLQIRSSRVLLGYGLGGSSVHFEEVVPPFVQEEIRSVKWEDLPGLNSLIGRIFAETGLVGFTLFLAVIFTAIREALAAKKGSREAGPIAMAVPALATLFTGLFVGGQGSYASPYLWWWLALIESRYIEWRKRGLDD